MGKPTITKACAKIVTITEFKSKKALKACSAYFRI
jgi:hypothetical protein